MDLAATIATLFIRRSVRVEGEKIVGQQLGVTKEPSPSQLLQ